MSPVESVLAVNDDLPVRTQQPVHSGKVRSVYWLTAADSARLIAQRGYGSSRNIAPDAPLAIMVISDRLSAFDCGWRAQGGMAGVPGKGAALNAISNHWFECFRLQGLAESHILEVPHPLVWIVQKARPILIEAIARQYITGSMWRSYAGGEREFCGIALPDDLAAHQKLPELLITPSTKGILRGIPTVPESDDVNVSREILQQHYEAFQFEERRDVQRYERLLSEAFHLISDKLAGIGLTFVDTKFEFGYVNKADGERSMIYMDEVGTPDSSRIWDTEAFRQGRIVENSKEGFRQWLLEYFPDPDILLNKSRMDERQALAMNTEIPTDVFMQVSQTYRDMAEAITGRPLEVSERPRDDIIAVLGDFDLVD